MIIEYVYDTIGLILNKNRKGFVKNSEKNTAIRQAQIELFNKYVEVYRKQGYIPTAIKKFVKESTLNLTNGVASLPSNFSQEITFETDFGSQGLFLSPEEYRDRMMSVILIPDQDNPIAKLQDGKIIVQPDEFNTIQFIHFRQPVDPMYAITVSGDGRSEVFNLAGSVDIEFGAEYTSEILRLALMYLGVAFQNSEALQLGIAEAQNDK